MTSSISNSDFPRGGKRAFGIPRQFLAHASREEIVDALRLRPGDLAAETMAALDAPH